MNHYETLEVSRLASPEVIRAAYRSLMQRFHPDRNPGDAAAAARAAAVARAYEVLSDPQQRCAYDASLQAAGAPFAAATAHDAGFAAPPAPLAVAPAAPGRSHPALVRRSALKAVLALLAVIAAAAGFWLSRPPKAGSDPAAELAAIRSAMSSDATPEAERRRLYVRKLTIIERHPELLRRASAERSEEMAARTFALLTSPLVVRLEPPPTRAGPSGLLTIPAASLLVGSFDAPNLLAHMARHRERLVQDLADRLADVDVDRLSRPDGEMNLKRIVAEAVNASLAISDGSEYPSTYFESPGAYGVVAVLLPDRFALVQLETPP